MHTLGIDLSSKAIDLVLLAEDHDLASWTRIALDGPNAFERARDVHAKMPTPSWYEDRGVYLVAIERPFSQSRNDTVRLVQGCLLAAIPRHLDVWEVAPQTWKAHIGFKQRGKPSISDFPVAPANVAGWPQDALDALGVALYARDTNANIISRSLEQQSATAA